MNPPSPPKRHSFRPLLLAPPPGSRALPRANPPPLPQRARPDAPPSQRARSESHVRLRTLPTTPPIEHLDAQDLLDELGEDELILSMSLACLERAAEDAPRDATTGTALGVLTARIADLGALRDQLAAVHALTVDSRAHRFFLPDGPLADYLRGLYAWAHAVVRALEELAVKLPSSPAAPPASQTQPTRPAAQFDWALLRWRLQEAKNFHFDELHAPIRAHLASSGGSPAELRGALEQLFVMGHVLEQRLDERFA
jgi:hypothetical protein